MILLLFLNLQSYNTYNADTDISIKFCLLGKYHPQPDFSSFFQQILVSYLIQYFLQLSVVSLQKN